MALTSTRVDRNGRVSKSRTPIVKNKVIVNADNEDEAARKGIKYFRYTSRDAYAIDSVREISPGKWQVNGLIRNPSASDKRRHVSGVTTTKTVTDTREPYDEPEDET